MSVLWAKRGWVGGGTFGPHQLFASGAQGAWYDPSDFSTLFQNSTGTTPVTAVEQPVRLMLDRSRGLVLGANIRNGTVQTVGSPAQTATYNSMTGAAFIFRGDGSNLSVVRIDGLTANVAVEIVITVAVAVSGVIVRTGSPNGSSIGAFNNSTGTQSRLIIPQASSVFLSLSGDLGLGQSFTLESVRELPGNHATAPNDASRPVLRSRYNLLTYSEQFDNAAWSKVDTTVTANAIAAPNGTLTADLCTEGTAGSGAVLTASAVNVTVASPITATIFAKRGNSDWLHIQLAGTGTERIRGWFNLATGTAGSTAVTGSATGAALAIEAFEDGWYRCRLTGTLNGAGSTCAMLTTIMSADTSLTRVNNSTRYIWGAQLLTAADQASTGGAYQRIAAATDYDTSNPVWRPYLAFDGSDDSFSTSSIDFSATDEMTVFAGVTKLSDAAAGIVAEFSATVASNNGSFYIIAPPSIGSSSIGFASKGTSQITVSATGIIAPSTSVISCITDISSDITTIRVNASQAGTSGGDLGTGNFGNHPLFIGRRNNTNLPFNGRLTSLIVLGRTATAAEISATESWINGKTGAY